MSDAWTILKMLQWTADYLKSKKFESPRLEAEVLLAHLLNLKRIDLYVQFERILTPGELTSFKALLKRRVDHEPLAYIVGKKEFYGREFLVTPDVLVPRPETELVVEQVLKSLVPSPESRVEEKNNKKEILTSDQQPATSDGRVRGLEIGLGSGCIAITLLCEIPTLFVDAIDISEKAIEIAKQNAEKNGVVDRLKVIQGDFLEFVIARSGATRQSNGMTGSPRPSIELGTRDDSIQQYDFIVSNPPYVSTVEMNQLPETVKKFEPRVALEGGEDGLLFYPSIAEYAKKHLKENGFLAVEIGEDQGYRVAAIFRELGFVDIAIRKDLAGRERVVVGVKSHV